MQLLSYRHKQSIESVSEMSEQRKRIVIVGGGITGLSAAFYLQKEVQESHLPIDIVLLEASNRLGGKIETVRRDGFIIERGPDSFLIRKKSMGQLAEDVGVADQLVKNATGQAYIWSDEQLHPIPAGSVMGIPTAFKPFMASALFSFRGKLRAAGDFILPRSKVQGDQSLGSFFKRRLGTEVVENLIEPLLSGVYAGDIDQMSLQATYPQFAAVERNHRSLIQGMKKTSSKKEVATKKRAGAFHTLKDGLETIVEATEQQLTGTMIKKNCALTAIDREVDRYVLQLNDGEKMMADAVILTTSHQVAGALFAPHGLLQQTRQIPTTSVATIALAFSEGDVEQHEEGTGFLVSRKSHCAMTACTWTHRKWPTTTPNGKILLRAFVGKIGDEAVVDLSDEQIEQLVLNDLRKMMTIHKKPQFSIVTRWKEDRPQYRVGHQTRIAEEKNALKEAFPLVKLAGASYEGVGLPDCVDQGKAAVREVLDQIL